MITTRCHRRLLRAKEIGALVQAEQDSTPTERRGPLQKLRLLAVSLLVTGLLLEVGIRVFGLAGRGPRSTTPSNVS